MFLFSPLEQFNLFKIISINLFNLDFSVTNSVMYKFLVLFFICLFFILLNLNLTFSNITNFQVIIEYLWSFIFSIIEENLKKKNTQYSPLIFTIFLFILFSNILGMIPYSYTITSHFSITFTLSAIIFIGLNIISIQKHKIQFFGLFLPSGSPLIISPLLVIIELISYLARLFSLSIRLFANMMAGHTLLKILSGFSFLMLFQGKIWIFVQFIPLIIINLLFFLEGGIAFLQAYIFTLMICIYLKDGIFLH